MIESLILKNKVTSESILIDKEISEFVLNEADLGVVEATHHSYSHTNQIGKYIESTSLEPRLISITGWVIGDTYDLLESNKKILNRLINPRQEVEITLLEDYVLTFQPDYSIKYAVPYAENNEVLCQFLIQGTCADPTFTTKIPNTVVVASTQPKFKFPWVIPQTEGVLMGLREPSLLTTILNKGSLDTGMEVVFTCTTPVTNPSLMNVNTRESFKINKVLSPGEKVVVSTVDGSKFIRGIVEGIESNYFRYWDIDSTWLQLHEGENILKYDADENSSGLDVSISFLPRFLEVQ